MKKAISYVRGERVFTHGSSKTTAGVWVLELPALVANASDVETLGQQIAQALRASKEGIPHPVSWKGIFDPVLKLAGVKAWATFVKTVRCVEVEELSDHISFVSTENLGANGGFNVIGRTDIQVMLTDAKALGGGLLAAFEKAK